MFVVVPPESGCAAVRMLASGSVASFTFTVPKINFQQNKDLFFLMLLGLIDLQNNNIKVDLHLTAKYTMCRNVTVCKLRCPGSLPSTCIVPDVKKAASWYSKLLTVLSKKIYFIYPEYLDDCITDVSQIMQRRLCVFTVCGLTALTVSYF